MVLIATVERMLKAGNPFGSLIFAGLIGGKAIDIEHELHTLFQEQRVEREVFALSVDDITFIKQRLQHVSNSVEQWG